MKRVVSHGRLRLIGVVALAAVGAGSARPQTAQPVPPLTATAPSPRPQVPAPIVAPAPPPASRCEAAQLAWLVGRPRTEIPVPVDLSRRRVSCTTCPVTQDYQPDRTDILFDARSGLITEVKCG